MIRLAILFLILALAGCNFQFMGLGGGNSGSGPNVGQWVAGTNGPPVNGSSWAIPCCNGNTLAGYFYMQLPVAPKLGQTLTMNYSLVGNNPVFQQGGANANNPSADINPPTIHLLLWQRDDNLSCAGDYNYYRLFAARTPLVLGTNQTVSAVLTPTNWTACYGSAGLDAARLQTTLNNLLGAGVTFGGQYFAGHGIYLSSGSATFTVNSFTVQ